MKGPRMKMTLTFDDFVDLRNWDDVEGNAILKGECLTIDGHANGCVRYKQSIPGKSFRQAVQLDNEGDNLSVGLQVYGDEGTWLDVRLYAYPDLCLFMLGEQTELDPIVTLDYSSVKEVTLERGWWYCTEVIPGNGDTVTARAWLGPTDLVWGTKPLWETTWDTLHHFDGKVCVPRIRTHNQPRICKWRFMAGDVSV